MASYRQAGSYSRPSAAMRPRLGDEMNESSVQMNESSVHGTPPGA